MRYKNIKIKIQEGAKVTEKQGNKLSQREHSSQQGKSVIGLHGHSWFCRSGVYTVIEAEPSLHREEGAGGAG